MRLSEEMLALNKARSEEFCTITAGDDLAKWNGKHPTKILVFKCMDGRVNLPLITGVPLGKLHPFRNIGGKFTLGDPYLGRLVLDARDDAIRTGGRSTVALCTYHFSKGSEHRGCAGHKYDTDAARRGAFGLKKEFEEAFGAQSDTVSAIVVGVETDEDSLIFVNGGGKEISIADHIDSTDEALARELFSLYPNLSQDILDDLLPLATGNRDHVAKIRREGRQPTEFVHNENIIAVGRGFDWLHLPNRALIIGPYGHTDGTWREAIGVAGKIVLDNFKNNEQLHLGGALLLVSAPYTQKSRDRGVAVVKARNFAKIAEKMLEPYKVDLNLETLVGVTNMDTMRFEPLSAV